MEHAYIDEYSNIESFFNRLDPRIKIAAIFALIISITLTKPGAGAAFFSYFAIIAVLILLSRIPVIFIIKRSACLLPLLVMFAAAAFLFKKKNAGADFDGLEYFYAVSVKSYLSVLCAVLLTAGTNFSHLLKAFEMLRCPRLITMIISFMYRYIFVVQDEFMRMKLSIQARSSGNKRWLYNKTLANIAGILFVRSYEKAEAVYLAMCSRGFNGNIHTMNNLKIVRKDWIFLVVFIMALGVIYAKSN